MVMFVKFWSLRISILIVLSFGTFQVFSQLIINDTLSFNQKISSSSVDRVGNLYLAFEDGTISKYNSELDSLVSYSPGKTGKISLLEAWHGFQVFSFNEEFQEFLILNRFLTQDTEYYLPDIIADYVNQCTLSNDQNLWVFNETGFKLMKVNIYTKEVLIDNPLEFLINEDDSQIIFMKEYQNKLFLLINDSTIYIFDNLGNYLNKIEANYIIDFCFYRDQLYYLGNESINRLHLYKGTSSKTNLPKGDYQQIEVFSKNSLLLFEGNRIYLASINE